MNDVTSIVKKFQSVTAKVEPGWTLIGAPVTQEFVFRFIPYQLYLIYGRFYVIGIMSSFLFAVIHWYLGKWFTLYTFAGGMVAWFVMVNYGFVWAVILHVAANAVLLRLGLLQKLKEKSGRHFSN